LSIFFDSNIMIKEIKSNLKELDFSPNEIKVYIALTQLGESTAAQIAKKADLPRTTAISILDKLKNGNLLTTHKYRGVTYYWIESPRILKESLVNKMEVAGRLDSLLKDLYRTEARFPTVESYDTKSNIRKFIEKIIFKVEKKGIIYTIDTPHEGNYAKVYSENIENMMLELKKKKEIVTYTLVPHGSYKNIPKLKLQKQNIIIKELPLEINFNGSLWILNDLIVHFSGNPPFVVAIKHALIYQGIRSIYNYLWNISK
jgi:sugar-specific transcriptional regulator TrmB